MSGEFIDEVILMLSANVRLEVVAGNQKVCFEQEMDYFPAQYYLPSKNHALK
jgi:hypothetical protein